MNNDDGNGFGIKLMIAAGLIGVAAVVLGLGTLLLDMVGW